MNRNAKVIMRSPLCVNQLRFNLSDECDAMQMSSGKWWL